MGGPTMDRDAWLDVVLESMLATWGLIARRSEGGRAIERDGVFAAVVPATPKRSVSNSVIYTDPVALAASLDELASAYDEAGVDAWTVWVPEDDAVAIRALERAGHVLDAEPRAMGAELDAIERPDLGELDWFRDCDLAAVARVNDEAYGYGDEGFAPVITRLDTDEVHTYGVRVDGETAGVMVAIDAGDDTEIAWVATSEAARGRGLATALMRQSLWDARERGRRTSTLQATKLGAPVYERVGFRDLGALQMWERRR
ncbi:MAG TPA: GNAT family N-acetyltransferase [Solirubrobacterales bacterium]